MTTRAEAMKVRGSDYVSEYTKGRQRSQRVGTISDYADGLSGERFHAWMDGYLDHAVGRPMWHAATCVDPDNHELCGL